MQSRGDKGSAKKFRKLLMQPGFAPRAIVTGKLKSYGAAKKEIVLGVEHRQHEEFNHRAQKSHQPTRTQARRMGWFQSPSHAQRLSAFEPVRGHFHPKQHPLTAKDYREQMHRRFKSWRELTGLQVAADPGHPLPPGKKYLSFWIHLTMPLNEHTTAIPTYVYLNSNADV